MPGARFIFIFIGTALTLRLLTLAPPAASEEVYNVTGLPAYPHLNKAVMDSVARTDGLGHWCTHLAAETSDPLEIVEAWYRKVLVGASETDASHDEAYKNVKLSGIELALGIDHVAVYKVVNQASTSIELVRCSP